jgi:hypothetical protein
MPLLAAERSDFTALEEVLLSSLYEREEESTSSDALASVPLMPEWWIDGTADLEFSPSYVASNPSPACSNIPRGRIVYQGNLTDVGSSSPPIPAVYGRVYKAHVCFDVSERKPGCINCGVTIRVGEAWGIWRIACFTGYGESGSCTATYVSVGDDIYIDETDSFVRDNEGQITVVDTSYTGIPSDQTYAPLECPIGSSESFQNWVGGPINTHTGNYHYSQ